MGINNLYFRNGRNVIKPIGNEMVILLTGGHAGSTAYSLIERIKKSKPLWRVIFVGAGSAFEDKKVPTLESEYFPKIGVQYIPLTSGRLQRKYSIWTIPSLMKIPVGFFQAFYILVKVHPKIIVSFGGFTAFPVVVMGKLLNIPVIIHEQTCAAGRANHFSSYFASKIALAREESRSYFKGKDCVVIGNPISEEITKTNKKSSGKRHFSIFITGGSRGSVVINENIKPILIKLLQKFKVYHQTGMRNYEDFLNVKKNMDGKYKDKYEVFPTTEMWNWSRYLDLSDIIVSRSGANIVSEILYLNIPSILIPIPYSFQDEQNKNAIYAKKTGLAKVIKETELTPDMLYKEILLASKNWNTIVENVKPTMVDDGRAAEKLLNLIQEQMK